MSKKNNIKKLVKNYNEYCKYEGTEKFTWCSGCGNYGVINAIKRALTLEKIKNHEALLCFDVGCNGNASDKINTYTIHGLHGRVISLASGAKIANPDIEVIATAGDGATFSEGIGHLFHSVRSDYPITFIHHNNANYGLTTGQASSTTKKGYPMNGSPDGVITEPLNPLNIVLDLNPSFVARTFSGDINHMTKMIQAGIKHKGFSFIEVLQTCPTYNKATPQKWYLDRIVNINKNQNHDYTDLWQAKKAVFNLGEKINVGIIYKNPNSKNFLERLPNKKQISNLTKEVKSFDINKLLEEF